MSTLKEQGINPTWLLERLAKDGFAELEGDFTDRTALRTMAHRVKGRVGEGLSIKTSLPKPTVLRVEVIPASDALVYRPRNKGGAAEAKPAPPEAVKPKRTRKTTAPKADIAEGPLAEALADQDKTRRHRRQQEKKEATAPAPTPVEPGEIGPGSTVRKPPGRSRYKVLEVRPNGSGTVEVHCVEAKGGVVMRGTPLRVFLLDAVVLVK